VNCLVPNSSGTLTSTTRGFSQFPLCLLTTSGKAGLLDIRLQLLLSTAFSMHYILITLLFEALLSELLMTSFNKL
jgi:hypothetical protein